VLVERLQILLGIEDTDGIDPAELEHEDERIELLERFAPLPPNAPARELRMSFRTVALTQALQDKPPATWKTFERLHDLGLHREQIYTQIVMVLGTHMSEAVDSGTKFDVGSYVAGLEMLPLPTGSEVAARLVEVVRSDQGISADDHFEAVVASFAPANGEELETIVDRMLDELVEGPVHWLTGDRTVYVPDLVAPAIFTHRYNESEAELGVLTAGFDLGAFSRFDVLELDDGTEVDQFSVEFSHLAWRGPDGWLDQFEPGELLAVSVEPIDSDDPLFEPSRAKLAIRTVKAEPEIPLELTDSVRAVYHSLTAESGLPVTGDELAWALLFDRTGVFEQVQASLDELCAAAGLQRRAGQVAHDEATWRRDLLRDRATRIYDMLDDHESKSRARNALGVLDDPDASDTDVQTALDECAQSETLDALADVLFGHYLALSDRDERVTPDAPGRLFELVARAVAVARRPRQVGAAHYLAAVLYERCADPETAEEHLGLSLVAEPGLVSAIERLGWYRFDRGDAAGAMRRWRDLVPVPEAARTIQSFLAPTSNDPKLGRNDPCWCGSGRKFKQCHQGSTALPALPDRVGWLCRKATTWLEHGTGDIRRTVVELTACRVTGDADIEVWQLPDLDDGNLYSRFQEAADDPIVFDAALHEGGLFRLFLRDRGPLLPDDEQLLAASWLTVDRSVHEVVGVDPGVSLELRDLATAEVAQVRERSASLQLKVGDRICARVVPDGASNQLIGGMFPVSTGTEETVLDLCERGDAHELCAWVGQLHQGPSIVHSPGMLDDLLDRETIDALMSDLGGDVDEDTTMATLQAEVQRQLQTRWLDDNVPALGGVTPRQAAADPTRRAQLERLLDEFEDNGRRMRESDAVDGAKARGFSGYDVPWLRSELGLGLE
jgi:hypothetical protein